MRPASLLTLLAVLAVGPAASREVMCADDVPQPAGVLRTIDGGSIPGRFVSSTEEGIVRWQGESFVGPFEFPHRELATVEFSALLPQVRMQGEAAVELAGGDLLTGTFLDWDDDLVTLESRQYGTIRIRTSAIRRFYRLQDNPTLLFPGLSGLNDDWQFQQGEWLSVGGQIASDKPGAMLGGRIPFPDKVTVEFELSWTTTPNFVVALGVDPKARKDRRQDGYRFETWGSTLAIVREAQEIADVGAVVKLDPDRRRVHLVCYLDQSSGRMSVHDADGKPLGKIHLPPSEPHQPGPGNQGIRFVIRQGDLRIDRLRVVRWDGTLPGTLDPGQMRLRLAQGESLTGQLTALDRDQSAWRAVIAGEQRRFAIDELVLAELQPTFDSGLNETSAVLQDGTRISGRIDSISGNSLTFRHPAIEEPLPIPFANLRALAMPQQVREAESDRVPGRGRLLIGEHELSGTLLSATESDTATCFVWQPVGSRVGSPLRQGIAAEIIFREAKSARGAAPSQERIEARQPGANFFNLLLQEQSRPTKRPTVRTAAESSLHLRSGDVIPGRVIEITDEGVKIDSKVVETTLIPHSLIKALELEKADSPPDLKEAKRQRLLTVPRLMKSSPPTHLLCSKTGDFLRCRLTGLADGMLRVELQLEEIQVPVDRVAQIIWFHPDELDRSGESPKAEDKTANNPGAGSNNAGSFRHLAQVIKPNGDRVTFDPVSMENGFLLGGSEVLGNVRFELSQIDRILIGGRIASVAASLPYHLWRLSPAKEPLVAQQGADGGPSDTGTLSPLVGQPAPDFQLDLLDGKSFRLSGHKGKIVVLDFWASWCGPCMQTMPLVEEAMREFDPAQVELISVNLEEPRERIQAALDRQGLQLTVAMDIDGTTARKYQANAIPQMVIVDATGKVARLYVGGGSAVVTQLRQALRDLLSAAP